MPWGEPGDPAPEPPPVLLLTMSGEPAVRRRGLECGPLLLGRDERVRVRLAYESLWVRKGAMLKELVAGEGGKAGKRM